MPGHKYHVKSPNVNILKNNVNILKNVLKNDK